MDKPRITTKIENDLRWEAYNQLDEKVFDCNYLPEYKLSVQRWYGYIADEDVKSIYGIIAKFAFEHKQKIVGSVTDLSATEGSFAGTNEWLITEYMPISVKYGFRVAANIRANDLYANLALEDLYELHPIFEHQIFDTFEEGYTWIINRLAEINATAI